ncbi:hypothetical protein AKJ57_01875, partial [candidate division MSBL1 archaeon SCGC-AAA259A05]
SESKDIQAFSGGVDESKTLYKWTKKLSTRVKNIKLVENARTYHRTTVTLEENKESYLPKHQITVSDNILERE